MLDEWFDDNDQEWFSDNGAEWLHITSIVYGDILTSLIGFNPTLLTNSISAKIIFHKLLTAKIDFIEEV